MAPSPLEPQPPRAMHPSAQNRPFRISRQTHPSPDTPSIQPQASRTPLNYRSNLTLTGSWSNASDSGIGADPRLGTGPVLRGSRLKEGRRRPVHATTENPPGQKASFRELRHASRPEKKPDQSFLSRRSSWAASTKERFPGKQRHGFPRFFRPWGDIEKRRAKPKQGNRSLRGDGKSSNKTTTQRVQHSLARHDFQRFGPYQERPLRGTGRLSFGRLVLLPRQSVSVRSSVPGHSTYRGEEEREKRSRVLRHSAGRKLLGETTPFELNRREIEAARSSTFDPH